jgi:hypothetical protein
LSSSFFGTAITCRAAGNLTRQLDLRRLRTIAVVRNRYGRNAICISLRIQLADAALLLKP